MNTYKVWIQIEEIDESKNRYLKLGEPYEAGKFDTEMKARRFVENELMIIRTTDVRLRNACKHVLHSLDAGGEQSRAFSEEIKILRDVLKSAPMVRNDCPKCGAGIEEREFIDKDILDIESLRMHFICKKCGSRIIEEFVLTDVFTANEHQTQKSLTR